MPTGSCASCVRGSGARALPRVGLLLPLGLALDQALERVHDAVRLEGGDAEALDDPREAEGGAAARGPSRASAGRPGIPTVNWTSLDGDTRKEACRTFTHPSDWSPASVWHHFPGREPATDEPARAGV